MRLSALMVLFVVPLTLGCAAGGSGDPPPIPIPTLEPSPQPFRTRTTFDDNVRRIDVRYHDGKSLL